MAEKQSPFSPSVPPLIPPPVSSPSSSSSVPPSSSASGVGFSSQSFQDQPLYSSILPKSQRKDHTHRPPSMTTPTTGVPSPSTNQDTSSDGGQSTLPLRIEYLEKIVSRLTIDKKGMEEEFGKQRKKFMQEMIKTENEYKKLEESLKKSKQQVANLNKDLIHKDEEMKNMAKKMNASLRETFDTDRVKYEEEISNLKTKLQESAHEHQALVEKLKAELAQEKKRTTMAESKSDTNLLNIQSPVKPSSGRKSPQRISGTNPPSASSTLNFSSEDSLDLSMIQAAHDAKLLKSVVVPLEEEIDMLKIQLKESQERLKVYEGKASGSFLTSSPDPPLSFNVTETLATPTLAGHERSLSPLEGGAMSGSSQDISEVGLLEKLLNQERTARYDLEMHIEGLRKQKASTMELNNELKEELSNVRKSLEEEKARYTELQGVWTRANLSFISTQDELKQKLEDIESSDEKKLKAALEPVGAYSPRPSSPLLPVKTHANRTSMRPDARRGRGRRRTVSWSQGDDHREEKEREDPTVWKAITEQLQRLLSQQHHDLQSKEAAVTAYEKQLERTQGQLMADIGEKDDMIFNMRSEVHKIQAALLRERRNNEGLKRKLATAKEGMKQKLDELHNSESKIHLKHKTFKEKFTETRHDIQKQLASFTEERTGLYSTISHREEEYACLKDLMTSEKIGYQSELDQLKREKAEAELNVASTMEELTKLREKSFTLESKLSKEVSELKDMVSSERQEKDNLESQLLSSINENSQLEQERHLAILSQTNLQERSKDYMEEKNQRILELEYEKEENSKTMLELKQQLSLLKQQLANTESVQKDFVELSQSLQSRLVEVESRQQEEEHRSLSSSQGSTHN